MPQPCETPSKSIAIQNPATHKIVFFGCGQFLYISNKTIEALNHFSHNGNATHAELCDFFEPKGIVVGYG